MSRTAISIGNFDGVHLGHQRLIRRARELCGPAGRVVALAFDPHPTTRLRPAHAPARLTSFEQRADLLRDAGADLVEPLEPTDTLLARSPEDFIRDILSRHAPAYFVEGHDFRFGHQRRGSVRTLHELGARHGFVCDVVEPVDVVLGDHQLARASSTLARWLLTHGRVADVARVLGRPYEIIGEVVPGDRRGRQIGVPTANIRTEQALPAEGVYAGVATLPDARRLPAAVSVSSRPTFDGVGRRLEAHLLLDPADAAQAPARWAPIPGLPEYAWPLRIALTSWIRDDLRFDSVGALCDQMARDIALVRRLAHAPALPTLPLPLGSSA
ncbi:MAG: riboflavin kinase [Planctomycetota bacterium]|nr:riboflavin kinase [Planctomycetota bacterium]